jgi:hypothetical protein
LGATALAFALGKVLRTLGAVFLLGGVGLSPGEGELTAEGRREIAMLMSFFPAFEIGIYLCCSYTASSRFRNRLICSPREHHHS